MCTLPFNFRLQRLVDSTFTYARLSDNVKDNSVQVVEIRLGRLQQELPTPNSVLSTSLQKGRSVTESVADNNDQVSEIRLGGLRLSFPSKTSTWPDLAKSPLLSLYSYGAKQACNGFLPWKLVQQARALLNMIFGFSCIETVHTKHNPPYNTRPSTNLYYPLTFHFELQYIITRN